MIGVRLNRKKQDPFVAVFGLCFIRDKIKIDKYE